MPNSVLIVGSGGPNKYKYLSYLKELGADVVVLEPLGKWLAKSNEDGHIVYTASFNDRASLISKAKEIASKHKIAAVDTIFELTMESAAIIREKLGLPGLTEKVVRLGRNKTEMIPFLAGYGIRTSPFIIFNRNDSLDDVMQQMEDLGDGLWILKPDALAAKMGVRKIKKIAHFAAAFNDAQYDIEHNAYSKVLSSDASSKWIVCKYITGHEMETEVCVYKGKVIFSAYLFKTINIERERGIEENRYVTPVPWLSARQLKDLGSEIEKLGKVIYEHVMKPCGKEMLILHPEYKIDKENKAYLLECAFRNGGGLNPFCIEYSTGVDPYRLSARATLNLEPDIKQNERKKAAGYQMLFSDRPGVFESVSGIKDVPGAKVWSQEEIGYKVGTPHAEGLLTIIAYADEPEKVEELLNESVKEIQLHVNGHNIPSPISEFVYSTAL